MWRREGIEGKAGKGDNRLDEAPLPLQCMGEEGRDYLRRYLADTSFAHQVMKSIDEDGYCVLPGIFSAQEADAELQRAWEFVERVSPSVKRDDWSTWWSDGSGPDPWPHAQRDMMQLHQAGWVFSELREKMADRVFEKLYGSRELHVSKDGFTFQRPTDGELGRSPNDHFDQGLRWMGLQCIQGSVALTDQSNNDGCFKVWPGSHRHREEILSSSRHQKARNSDFIIMKSDEHEMLRQRGVEPRRVPVERGDVILWRSDVVHCGAPPVGRCDTCRVVVYICCLPADLTPESVYEQKRRAYLQLETSGHYPTREEWFEKTEKHSRICWKPYLQEPPQLSLRQRQLYGLERYASTQVEEACVQRPPAEATASTTGTLGPVPGIELCFASLTAVRETLTELRPHFHRSFNKSSSDMFEVGWSFHAMERDKVMRIAQPLSDFPCLVALIIQIVRILNPGDDDITLGEDTVNIICRRYTRGQGLPKHLDRPELFDEDVYGCVLHNTSEQSLTFEQLSRSGEVIAGPHVLEEKPGMCFRAQGPARYEWVHGVSELSCGERISITWRWIQGVAAAEGHEVAEIHGAKGKGKSSSKSRKGKGASKGKGQRKIKDGLRADHDDNGNHISKHSASKATSVMLNQSTAVANADERSSGFQTSEAFAENIKPSNLAAVATRGNNPSDSRRNRWGRK
jgi:hypothetical protein